MRPTLPTIIYRLALVLAVIAPAQAAVAAAWDWGSQVRLTGTSNDNPTLRSDTLRDGTPRQLQSAESFNASAELNLIRATPNSKIEITPRVSRNYYPDDAFKDLENTNWYLITRSVWTQPRTSWTLNFRLEDVSLLSNEDNAEAGTGGSLFRVDDTRSLITIAPGVSWIISELDQVRVGASWSSVDYALDFTNRADQNYGSVSVSYLRAITPRQTLGLLASASHNESDRLLFAETPLTFENETDGINLNLDYLFQVSPDLLLSVQLGRQESDAASSGVVVGKDPAVVSDNLSGDCSSLVIIGNVADPNDPNDPFDLFQYSDCKRATKTTVYSANITKNFELSTLSFSAIRSIVPSSTGAPQERNQLTLKFDKTLSESLRFDTTISGYEQESINFKNLSTENKNFRGAIGIDWVITRNWAVGAEYIYRYRDNGRTANLDLPAGTSDPDLPEPLDSRDSNEFGFYVRYFIERPEL